MASITCLSHFFLFIHFHSCAIAPTSGFQTHHTKYYQNRASWQRLAPPKRRYWVLDLQDGSVSIFHSWGNYSGNLGNNKAESMTKVRPKSGHLEFPWGV